MQWAFNRLIKVSFKEYFSSNEFQIILKFIGRPVDHYGVEKFWDYCPSEPNDRLRKQSVFSPNC